ncbi:hypothetical protein [Demequina litorisediminis]|uniref:hypothetical protein n=1 Tax=Demequina litorisediminis TaxID=1849022 RepID=UPI0024E08A5B|nr:hypothetical protein [Demequina litorisediminis]
MRVDTNGEQVFGEGDESVFALLDSIAADLRNGVPVSTRLNEIDDRMNTMLAAATDVGVRMKQVTDVQSSLALRLQDLSSAISGIEDIDLAQTVMEPADAGSRLPGRPRRHGPRAAAESHGLPAMSVMVALDGAQHSVCQASRRRHVRHAAAGIGRARGLPRHCARRPGLHGDAARRGGPPVAPLCRLPGRSFPTTHPPCPTSSARASAWRISPMPWCSPS